MTSIARYLESQWQRDGMDYPRLNCWGLVRLVRHELYDLPLLPGYDIVAEDKIRMTSAAYLIIASKTVLPCEPHAGAIASAWRGRLCAHVGVVVPLDGRLGVLDMDEATGVSWRPLRQFEYLYTKVEYYT